MFQQIFAGLVIGSMYALLAVGYTLVFGLLKRLNIAHGEVMMFGGFAGLIAFYYFDLPAFIAIIFAIIVTGVLGLLIEFICFKPLIKDTSGITPALSTVALGLVIHEIVVINWGSEPVRLPVDILQTRIDIFGVAISQIQILIFVLSLVTMVILYYIVQKTKIGREIRAIADSPVKAALLGINQIGLIRITFFVSSGLAGMAGILYAMRIGMASPEIGIIFGFKALAIMAIGGIGDLRGAMIAGLLIGVIEALSFHFGFGGFAELVVWIALILILIFKPSGLFGGSASQGVRA